MGIAGDDPGLGARMLAAGQRTDSSVPLLGNPTDGSINPTEWIESAHRTIDKAKTLD